MGKAHKSEYPRLRKWIMENGTRPYPSVSGWDHRHVTDNSGQVGCVVGGMRYQLEKMLREGYFKQKEPVASLASAKSA